MFTLEKRTALGPRTWGPSAKLTVSSANAWFKFFQFRGGRIAVDLWVFQDLARAAERTPRPHPVTSFVLSAVLLISFRLIQFSGTLAFYHKTIFMVRCFFCRRPHLMLIEGRLTTSVRHKFWFSKNFKYTYGHKYRPTSTTQWQVNKVSENNSCQQQ